MAKYPISVLTSDIYLQSNGWLEVAFFKDPDFDQECFIISSVAEPIPGSTLITYAFIVSLPVIPANSSKTCHGIYHVGLPQGKKVITWHAYSFTDDMISNGDETVDMVFGIKPQVIPTTTILSLFLLALLMFVIIYFKYLRGSDEKFNIH